MQWLASKLGIPNTRKDNTLILYDLCLGVKNRVVPQVTSLWAPLTTMGNNSNTTQQQQSTLGISGSWHYIYKEDMKWHRGLSWWKYVAITGDQTYLEAFLVSLSTNKYNKVHAYTSYDHCNSNHERKQLPTGSIRPWHQALANMHIISVKFCQIKMFVDLPCYLYTNLCMVIIYTAFYLPYPLPKDTWK